MKHRPGVSVDDVTSSLTGSMTVTFQDLNNGAKVFLLYERHRLKKMGHLHLEVYVDLIEKHNLVPLMACKDMVAIRENKWIKLCRLASEATGIMYFDHKLWIS